MNEPYWKHPDWKEFVKKIRGDYAENTTRLVAADWLQDRGEDKRAELIRLQMRLSELGPPVPKFKSVSFENESALNMRIVDAMNSKTRTISDEITTPIPGTWLTGKLIFVYKNTTHASTFGTGTVGYYMAVSSVTGTRDSRVSTSPQDPERVRVTGRSQPVEIVDPHRPERDTIYEKELTIRKDLNFMTKYPNGLIIQWHKGFVRGLYNVRGEYISSYVFHESYESEPFIKCRWFSPPAVDHDLPPERRHMLRPYRYRLSCSLNWYNREDLFTGKDITPAVCEKEFPGVTFGPYTPDRSFRSLQIINGVIA